MSTLRLIKMHGCENDYLFVDCFTQPVPEDPGALSRRLSARHTGIGADGLILMRPPQDNHADGLMEIYNADGSSGGMCGNALRCFAFWLHRTGRTDACLQIAVGERLVEARVLSIAADGRSGEVSVCIGHPQPLQLAAAETADDISPAVQDTALSLPKVLSDSVRAIRRNDVRSHGRPLIMHCVSMGNPHAVLFVKQIESLEFLRLGPIIERHPMFADRANVEFATITGPNTARVRVWERGSGETRACGSGACAVTVAGLVAGWFHIESPVQIRMNGGWLQTAVDVDGRIALQGEAVEVADVIVAV